MMRTIICAALACLYAAALCAADGESLHVIVSVPPHAYLVERIGGARVTVDVLLRQGQDPHTFEPSPRQVVSAGRARILFKIGFPFEERVLEKLGDGGRKPAIVDIGEGVARRRMEDDIHEEDGHAGEEHSGSGLDPHIWLAVAPLKIQAGNIARALVEADPAGGAEYNANLKKLEAELDETRKFLSEKLGPLKGGSFFVFHPSFGYFADEYGLRQEAVETGGKAPSARQTAALIRKAKAQGVKIILVQPQYDRKGADAIASAIGGTVEPLDALARDVQANLRAIGIALEKASSRAGGETGKDE